MAGAVRVSRLLLGLFVATLVVAAVVRVATGEPQAPRSVPPLADRVVEMRHHFRQVTAVHEAVVQGDLAAVRGPAGELARMATPPDAAVASVPHAEAMRAAGRNAAGADTLAAAARSLAGMLDSCAACHRASGVTPSPVPPARPELSGIAGRMFEHQRAADEMLVGLLLPSSSSWQEGAMRLRVATLRPSPFPPDRSVTPAIERAEDRVRQVADRAVTSHTSDTRAATYAELLTSCAECHGLYRQPGTPMARALAP